jgi:hypothetical protein
LIRPRDRAPPPTARVFIEVLRAYVGELAERGLPDITIGTSDR